MKTSTIVAAAAMSILAGAASAATVHSTINLTGGAGLQDSARVQVRTGSSSIRDRASLEQRRLDRLAGEDRPVLEIGLGVTNDIWTRPSTNGSGQDKTKYAKVI